MRKMVSFGLGKKKKDFFWSCHDCGTKKKIIIFFFYLILFCNCVFLLFVC